MDLDLIQRPLDQVQGPWIQWTENSRFSFQSRKVPAASVFEQNWKLKPENSGFSFQFSVHRKAVPYWDWKWKWKLEFSFSFSFCRTLLGENVSKNEEIWIWVFISFFRINKRIYLIIRKTENENSIWWLLYGDENSTRLLLCSPHEGFRSIRIPVFISGKDR